MKPAAASAVPARIGGRADLGLLAPGPPAAVVVLDDRLEIQQVLAGGAVRVALAWRRFKAARTT